MICISIKTDVEKNWAIWWDIFWHCCYYYFVNIVIFLYLHELVLLETLFFLVSFFLFVSLKRIAIDCIFYILKLNFIGSFGAVIISTSTKNKLIIIKMIIIVIIWNLWAAHLLYLYMYLKTFALEVYWHHENELENIQKNLCYGVPFK